MPITHGGVHEIGLLDPDTGDSVYIDLIHEDFTVDTEAQLYGLSNGQGARASTVKEAEFFAIDLTSAQQTQLKTWDDNETGLQLLIGGLDYTVCWADPSKLHVGVNPGAPVGELGGYKLRLRVER